MTPLFLAQALQSSGEVMDRAAMTMLVDEARRDGRGCDGSRIVALHYDELRKVARRIIVSDAQRHALQATELVNEAVLRLIRSGLESVSEREHLLALAARTMRRILIDEARKALAAKRQPPPLITQWPGGPAEGLDLEALDEAIAALEAFSPEHGRVVELRFGLGLTVEETARLTGMPERTIKRRWQAARAWLHDHMTRDGSDRDA